MRVRKIISRITATVLMSFISISSIPVSAVEEVTTKEPVVTAKANNKEGFVHLDWTRPSENGEYAYTIHSKRINEANFQSIPAKGSKDDPIKVLNVYPDKGDNLKSWMEDTIYGKGIIKVDPVGITEFNKEPYKHLKDDEGKYKYDVIMFGSWDCNNGYRDLNEESYEATDNFIQSGRGVLFGHDTLIMHIEKIKYFAKFAKACNVEIRNQMFNGVEEVNGFGAPVDKPYVSNIIRSKKGLLTNYPWDICEKGLKLQVPVTHTSQKSNGDIWMRFDCSKYTDEQKHDSGNVYLATWNNTAVIGTGHDNGKATEDEQKLLANTLFYLAQVTDNTSWDDHKGQDVEAPDQPTITDVKQCKENGQIQIKFNEPKDNSSTYQYYVEAIEKKTGNKIEHNPNNITTAEVKTGIKGYAVVVDQNPDTKPDAKKDFKDDINKELTYNLCNIKGNFDKDFYVHVAAVDNADNMSKVTHYKYEFPKLNLSASDVVNNEVKITAEGNKSVSKIVLPNGEEVNSNNAQYTVKANGTYEFTAYDADGNEVKESIKVNTIPTDITLNINDESGHAVLDWEVSDKSQEYSYNVYSKDANGKDILLASTKDTSYEACDDVDRAKPDEPVINNVDAYKENQTTVISYNKVEDNSTSYDYYVEAVSLESGKKSVSSVRTSKLLSGIKGYSIVVDNNPDTIPDGTITTTATEYTFNKAYKGHFYVHVAAIDNADNISEVSTYECNKPVLKLTPNTIKIVKDKVIITADASESLRNVVKIITPDNKVVAGNKAEYVVDRNGKYSFTAIDENGNETTETIEIKNIIRDIILDVEPKVINKHLEEGFVADLTLNNISNIFATEVIINYENSMLDFEGFEELKEVTLLHQEENDGKIKLILTSLNGYYPMSGKATLIKMKFRGKVAGSTKISVTRGIVADGVSKEEELRDDECGQATVNICDRKLKDAYTLLDLSTIVKHYGEEPEDLLKKNLDLDLNLDGKIDEEDSKLCKEYMFRNPNKNY